MSEIRFDAEIETKLQSLQGASFANNSTTTRFKSSTRSQKLHEDYWKTPISTMNHKKNENTNREFYKSNRAASTNSFLAALVVPHQELLGHGSA